MRILILLTIVLLTFPAKADIEPDKKLHFLGSGAMASIAYLGFRKAGYDKTTSYGGAFVASFAVGFLKEMLDENFDKNDLAADAIGSATIPILVLWY